MTQLALDSESESASRMLGSASAATVPSSTTSNCIPDSTRIGRPKTGRNCSLFPVPVFTVPVFTVPVFAAPGVDIENDRTGRSPGHANLR